VLRLYDRLVDLAAILAAAAIAFIALGVTADVAVRFAAGTTIRWMLEVSEYLLFAMTFLGAPAVLRAGAHTAVDVVIDRLPPAGRRGATLLTHAIGLVTSVGVAWYGSLATLQAWRGGTMVFKQITFPEWWLYALIAFCGVLLVIEFTRLIVRTLRGEETASHRQATA
jgi:TRAP-type C4-dicarboxylate transport system permease small subunit